MESYMACNVPVCGTPVKWDFAPGVVFGEFHLARLLQFFFFHPGQGPKGGKPVYGAWELAPQKAGELEPLFHYLLNGRGMVQKKLSGPLGFLRRPDCLAGLLGAGICVFYMLPQYCVKGFLKGFLAWQPRGAYC